jgi:hypothetical protein
MVGVVSVCGLDVCGLDVCERGVCERGVFGEALEEGLAFSEVGVGSCHAAEA